jgi:hypothetical protein
VLVDGEPRRVTPAERVAGRSVTTLDGLDAALRDRLVDAFVATGASQCGFCTPGILVRAAALVERGKDRRTDVDRALAAHLCRCTGWQTIYEAIDLATNHTVPSSPSRRFDAAARRAELEGGVAQRVGPEVPCGNAGFADDTAPRDALVAVPAANGEWVVAESPRSANCGRCRADGPSTSASAAAPVAEGGVRLATVWSNPPTRTRRRRGVEPGGEPRGPPATAACRWQGAVTAPSVVLAGGRSTVGRCVPSTCGGLRTPAEAPTIAASGPGATVWWSWGRDHRRPRDTSEGFVPPCGPGCTRLA